MHFLSGQAQKATHAYDHVKRAGGDQKELEGSDDANQPNRFGAHGGRLCSLHEIDRPLKWNSQKAYFADSIADSSPRVKSADLA